MPRRTASCATRRRRSRVEAFRISSFARTASEIDLPAGGDARWKYSYDADDARVGLIAQREGGTEHEFTYG
jgi:hypothetical protein